VSLSQDNPTASAFQAAAARSDWRAFGLILWAAALTR